MRYNNNLRIIISIHALRVEGDFVLSNSICCNRISIHALRVEGDLFRCEAVRSRLQNFYPRPPGGGRQPGVFSFSATVKFLSTPSGWRATIYSCSYACTQNNFYPRPPGGGRPLLRYNNNLRIIISIHALRVEGDFVLSNSICCNRISIHALRVEGDLFRCEAVRSRLQNFYPRPPGGGRQPGVFSFSATVKFLSTPSGWRATIYSCSYACTQNNFYPRPPGGGRPLLRYNNNLRIIISIHALRVEGDIVGTFDEADGMISIHALRVEGD